MPITFPAHQLVVLPLLRERSPMPGVALIVGTALPDMAFVVGGYGLNAHAHLGYGPLLMAPLGLLLYVWAEWLWLPALGRALPASGRWPLARLCTTRGLASTWSAWAWVLGAILLGAYSHVLFDGFTHARSWPARVLYPRLVASTLQYVCSIAGGLYVLVWAHRRMWAAPLGTTPRWAGGLRKIAVMMMLGGAIGLAVGLALSGAPDSPRAFVRLVLSRAALGAFLGATVAALAAPRDSVTRLVPPLAVLLVLAGAARAEEPKPPPPRGYIGASVGLLVFYGEASLDGGFAPVRDVPFVWAHARVLTGSDESGDFSSYTWKAGLAGMELRSTGRRGRGVIGFDLGAVAVEHYDEGTLTDTTTRFALTWHAGGELVLGGHGVVRLGLGSSARDAKIPLLMLGVAVQF